ncbi:alpha/beta hydrolase [Chromatiales bacterium (ex Bugula neritina AB1)]|nr:alpha/beta hydrolase [Chromatiales bacterium (ex Bugula neritina AB1)]
MCHVLEAGNPGNPCVLLLHGFPELAYSWRKVMLPLARAGFHVLAPDQRGYGRTTGSDNRYDGDVASFRLFNLVRDAMGVLFAFGHAKAASVVGHDFGSAVAAWCAVIRPDVFNSVVLMSAPFAGTPPVPLPDSTAVKATIDHDALAALVPPRKHYQWYYSTPEANANMQHCPQGLMAFLRAYYHHKSADWENNKPYSLQSWSADCLGRLPTYYVMHQAAGMAETVAPEMPGAAFIENHHWLPDRELAIYASEFTRTGFQGGLNWYRCGTDGKDHAELQTFSGLSIDIPSLFIAGASDWGIHQKPGSFELMQGTSCTNMLGCHLIDGAGHWVQQEQPDRVTALLCSFLKGVQSDRIDNSILNKEIKK